MICGENRRVRTLFAHMEEIIAEVQTFVGSQHQTAQTWQESGAGVTFDSRLLFLQPSRPERGERSGVPGSPELPGPAPCPASPGSGPSPARAALPALAARRSLLALLSWERLFQPGPGTDRCVWVRSGGCGGRGHTEQHGRSVSTRRAGCAQAGLTFAGVVAARRAGQAMRETCNTPGEWPAEGRGERQHLCPGIPSSVHCTEVKFSKTP